MIVAQDCIAFRTIIPKVSIFKILKSLQFVSKICAISSERGHFGGYVVFHVFIWFPHL